MTKIITEAVLVPNQNINHEKYDIFFSAETIKKLFKNFFSSADTSNVIESNIIESWIIKDENDKSYALGFNYPLGTWMATYKE